MYYLFSSSIGFFFHWIYQLVVSFWFKAKFSSAWDQYALVSSCSLSAQEQESIRQLGIKATLINEGFEQLSGKLIDDKDFENFCRRESLTEAEFERLQSDEYIGGVLDSRVMAYIKAKGLETFIGV